VQIALDPAPCLIRGGRNARPHGRQLGPDSLQLLAGLRVRDRGGGELAPQRRLLAG
jgi:hypothetical protein